ncbi:hypothetical protein [Paracoccus zeaxanthinifaciens]|uniref:hypothetical protein n=1 Tax=Paracoccus zeaxanthinifaciens TaxID=187400 RepID=UPI0003B4247C|nr:hypothetical protein [Paracoccus zeaxanthinifaciens]
MKEDGTKKNAMCDTLDLLLRGAGMMFVALIGVGLGALAFDEGVLNDTSYGLAILQFIGGSIALAMTPYAKSRNRPGP